MGFRKFQPKRKKYEMCLSFLFVGLRGFAVAEICGEWRISQLLSNQSKDFEKTWQFWSNMCSLGLSKKCYVVRMSNFKTLICKCFFGKLNFICKNIKPVSISSKFYNIF